MNFDFAETILKKYGEPLSEIGVNNWAVPLISSSITLKELYQNKIAVLGGDVLNKSEDNHFNYVYLNWYCERYKNETDLDFLNRSHSESQNFINGLVVNGKETLYIEFVV